MALKKKKSDKMSKNKNIEQENEDIKIENLQKDNQKIEILIYWHKLENNNKHGKYN